MRTEYFNHNTTHHRGIIRVREWDMNEQEINTCAFCMAKRPVMRQYLHAKNKPAVGNGFDFIYYCNECGIMEQVINQPPMTKADWLRSEIEKLEVSENTFFNDWNEEKEKLDDGTSKEDAVTFIEKIIPLAKTCPFCGKVPVFTYSVGKRDTSGYIGHFTKREGCCDATGMGKTELFFCNKDQSENYGLWAEQMFWQIQKWNERTNNQALTSIITRYKEELKVLESK